MARKRKQQPSGLERFTQQHAALAAELERISQQHAAFAAEFERISQDWAPTAAAFRLMETQAKEWADRWHAAIERILDKEAQKRGVSRGHELELALLVELRRWNNKTLREVLHGHRRPGRRKAAPTTDTELFAAIDRRLAENKHRSATAVAEAVAKEHGVSSRGLRERYAKARKLKRRVRQKMAR